MNRSYKSGENRDQSTLFPMSLDEYVESNNSVRAIDAYVETLDLHQLGFKNTQYASTCGQPAYNPADLLKLYLYGYINSVRSSRKLERETYRNIEVMWLLGNLQPCYKTIANFRKDNPVSLKATNRDFILLCRELSLFGGKKIAIDGSYFRGNASKASIYTQDKLERQLNKLNKQIEDYQKELDANDNREAQAGLGGDTKDPELNEKLALLKKRQARKQQQVEKLTNSNETQLSTTDPDARLLQKPGQLVSGYNVQSVVDDKHQLIVESKVTNAGNDFHQLYVMAEKAKKTLGVEKIIALADGGYYEGINLKQCEENHITAYVPIPDKSKPAKKQGRFTREAFTYDEEQRLYYCPQGNTLEQKGKPYEQNGKMHIRYASKISQCKACPVKKDCLSKKAKRREVHRWEHESVLERHRERMQNTKEEMRQRAALVEHPFGTLKDRAGYTYHFLVRGFKKVQGEWSIMALGYNFTRVLNILGIKGFIDYCACRKRNIENMAG